MVKRKDLFRHLLLFLVGELCKVCFDYTLDGCGKLLLGLYIVSDGVRIYVTGDTSCCPDQLAASLGGAPVDIMIVPVNPAFGNPGERNAAKMGRAFHPRVLIGAHFGMFDAHGGDPELFLECCRDELEPETEAFAAVAGRMLLFSAAQGMKEV